MTAVRILALLGVSLSAGVRHGDEPARPVLVITARRDDRSSLGFGTSGDTHEGREPRFCTVDQLLPGLEGNLQSRWKSLEANGTRPRVYDCTCPYTKAT